MNDGVKKWPRVTVLEHLNEWRRKINLAYLILCILGNAVQATWICKNYLAYDVLTAVDVAFPSTFVAPSASFCFFTITMINWDKFDKQQLLQVLQNIGLGNISTKDEALTEILRLNYKKKMSSARYFIDNHLVRDFFEVALEPPDIFGNCSYTIPQKNTIGTLPCSYIFNITRFFKETYICFRFEASPKLEYKYIDLQRVYGQGGFMFQIYMHENMSKYTNDVLVYIHPPGTFPRQAFTKSLYLHNIASANTLSYQAVQTKLMKAPYITDCRDYNLTGYPSRGGCVETCIQLDSLARFSALTPGCAIILGT